MSTTLYLRLGEAASGTLPTGYLGGYTGPNNSAAGGPNAKALDLVAGSSQLSTAFALSGAQQGIAQFISKPLTAQTIAAGSWTIGYGTEQSTSGALEPFVYISVVEADGATIRGTILASTFISESSFGTGEKTVWTASLSGSAVTAVAGDRLVVEIANTAGNTVTVYADGGTAITANKVSTSDAQSFLTCPAILVFQAPWQQLTDMSSAVPPAFRAIDRVVSY